MNAGPAFDFSLPLPPGQDATDSVGIGPVVNPAPELRDPPQGPGTMDLADNIEPNVPGEWDNADFRAKCELTDLENAERLVRRHGHELRYCRDAGAWFAWDDRRWRRGDNLAVEHLAKETVKAMRSEINTIRDSRERFAFEQRVRQAEALGRIRAMIDLARSDPTINITRDLFDRDPYLLNCMNGTIDLRSGELRPHDPADLITRLVPVRYRPQAGCPTWLRFLDRVCSHDLEMIRYLQQAAGYALTSDTREHCLFYLYGRGRNGKSVFLNTIGEIMGDYGSTVASELFTTRSRDQHPTGLTDLDGCRFVSTIEIEDGNRLAESLVKSLTGGDRIRARRLYHDFYEFQPLFKLFIAANHKLGVSGTDEGIWSRIRLIPFLEIIPEAERDPRLMDKLRAEAEGILAWMVRGCRDWQHHGLCEPDVVRDATAEYREESDPVGEFLATCCIFEPDASVQAGSLLASYKVWCRENAHDPLGPKAFSRALDERGIEKRKKSGNYRIGLQLREGGLGNSAT